jgi:NAD(P)-dependent dehydrogenase (short-subunit alcohol dehydrogenase family)
MGDMNMDTKVVLVTGGTSGIGKTIAGHLHAKGHKVYGAARRPEALRDSPVPVVKLDVDSDESVAYCVSQIIASEGKIDVLINSAGFGIAGPVEENSMAEVKAQFETNYFGVVRMCRAALPHMRDARKGLIINISSLGGLVSVPFHAHYCASKFAVEGLTEGLRLEVARFGIKVVLVEPGDYKTGFTSGRKIAAASKDDSPYNPQFKNSLKKMEAGELNGPEPAPIARLVARIIDTKSPKLRYPVAPFPQNLMPPLKRLLPWSAIEKIIASNYGIDRN